MMPPLLFTGFKNSPFPLSLKHALLAFCLLFGVGQCTDLLAASGGLRVAVTTDEIQFRCDSGGHGSVCITRLPLATNQLTADPAETESLKSVVVWQGEASQLSAMIPRFEGSLDRLFAKYRLCSEGGKEALGTPQYVTDFSALPRGKSTLGAGASK